MSLNTLFQELIRFIKDNLWRIIVGMIIGVLVAVSARYFISEFLLKEKSEAYDYLSVAYEQEPAEFQAAITIQDGDVFSNSNIYDDYFSSPAVVKQVEEKTGISFAQWIKSEQVLELKKNANFRGGIAAIRDSSSGLITFRFLVAKTSEENLKIAQAYEEILKSSEINFNKAHRIEITRPSEIIELLDLDEVTTVPTYATLNMFDGLSLKNIIIYTVVGSFIGFMLTVIVLWIKRGKNGKINYTFEYTWGMDDDHLLVSKDHSEDDINIEDVIKLTPVKDKIVLLQSNFADIHQFEGPDTKIISHLEDASELQMIPNEIIIIIISNMTDKSWFNHQYKLAKLINKPIKIVHMI